ncbi:hypothetical protein ABE10_03010, partial [Bacillus toyonensis]|nr:hypothetical protein [Bacillus toyonensis]
SAVLPSLVGGEHDAEPFHGDGDPVLDDHLGPRDARDVPLGDHARIQIEIAVLAPGRPGVEHAFGLERVARPRGHDRPSAGHGVGDRDQGSGLRECGHQPLPCVRGGGSALDGGAEVRGREVPLEQEEKDDHRDGEHARAGEDRAHRVVQERAVGLREVRQAHRQGLHRRVLGDQEGPEELVPGTDESHQHRGQHGGAHQGDGDGDQDAELARAVDPRRVEHVPGDLQEVLPEDEDGDGVDGERQYHPEEVVSQAEVAYDHDVERDHEQLERDGLDQEHQCEDDAAPAERQHGQRIADQQAEYQRAADHSRREDERVHQGAEEVHRLVDLGEVVQRQVAGQRQEANRTGVASALEGSDDHVVEGREGGERSEEQQDEAQGGERASSARAIVRTSGRGGHRDLPSVRRRETRETIITATTRIIPIAAAMSGFPC